MNQLFSILIDSQELSFSFEPKNLVLSVKELQRLFVRSFNLYLTSKTIEEMCNIFEYFSEPTIWRIFYTEPKYTNDSKEFAKSLRRLWDQSFRHKFSTAIVEPPEPLFHIERGIL